MFLKNLFSKPNSASNNREVVSRPLTREEINKKLARFGNSVGVIGGNYYDENVRFHLDQLSLVPDKLIDTMKSKGLRVIIGALDLKSTLETLAAWGDQDEGKGKYERLLQFARERKFNSAGLYQPSTKMAVASSGTLRSEKLGYPFGTNINLHNHNLTNPHGTSSLVLHEYGHGVGDLLGLDNVTKAYEAHIRLFNKLRLHARQSGPKDPIGVRELIADSFSDYYMMRVHSRGNNLAFEQQFMNRYDKPWFDFMKKTIDSLEK